MPFRNGLSTAAMAVMLSACGGGTSVDGQVVSVVPAGTPPTPAPTPTPSPAPSPTPTPAPTPAPSPTPSPAPTPSGQQLSGVLDEGDSISVFWGGNHTGIYAALRPTVKFSGKAVGGSGLASMAARFDADVAEHPAVVSILIGANDVAAIGLDWAPYKSAQQYLDALFAYTAKWKATGAKVVVGTILPQCQPNNPNNVNGLANANRIPLNLAIRAAAGTTIDGVVDYAADPEIGVDAAACDKTLFSDGLHPTDGSVTFTGGQGRMAKLYLDALDKIVR